MRRQHAGRSALSQWRANRRAAIRRDWRRLLVLVTLLIVSLTGIRFTDGAGALIWAGLAGGIITLVAIYWALGGDLAALAWAQGAWAERDTETELARLDASWHIEHDVPRDRGNWDHVAIGPPGVFMIETKRSERRIRVEGDALEQGRVRIPGAVFRGAAAGLHEAVINRGERGLWVSAVVAVWGDFEQAIVEGDRVTYLAGERLVDWLRGQPVRLTDARVADLVTRVQRFRST